MCIWEHTYPDTKYMDLHTLLTEHPNKSSQISYVLSKGSAIFFCNLFFQTQMNNHLFFFHYYKSYLKTNSKITVKGKFICTFLLLKITNSIPKDNRWKNIKHEMTFLQVYFILFCFSFDSMKIKEIEIHGVSERADCQLLFPIQKTVSCNPW